MTAADRADTIFALSSGAPPAAIAILRVSGPEAASVLEQMVGRLPQPRRATLRALRDSEDGLLDRALVLWFPGPETATGEDLVELHLHGGRAVVAAVSAALDAHPGCRPAEPGEFTRRAFLNGRIDLAEAEGLADLMAAETESARRQALRMAEGGLSAKVEQLRARLLGLAARAEAVLEFGDDEPDVASDPGLGADLEALGDELRDWLAHPPAERLRDGLRVVVAGPTNAGKSSLINNLAGRLAAIESEMPGTTRDLIEVPLILDGLPLLLIDSAGLRESGDAIERIGIGLARQAIGSADLVLWLGSADEAPVGAPVIRVQSKADLLPSPKGVSDMLVSAKTGQGMASLRQLLHRTLSALLPSRDVTLMTARQRALVADCLIDIDAARGIAIPELRAEHLRLGLRALDRLIGRASPEEMLDALFGRFCIGK